MSESRYFINKSGQVLELSGGEMNILQEINARGVAADKNLPPPSEEPKKNYHKKKENSRIRKRTKITPELIKNIQALKANNLTKEDVRSELDISWATVNKYWNTKADGPKGDWKPL